MSSPFPDMIAQFRMAKFTQFRMYNSRASISAPLMGKIQGVSLKL